MTSVETHPPAVSVVAAGRAPVFDWPTVLVLVFALVGSAAIWLPSVFTSRSEAVLAHPGKVLDVAFSADAGLLASAGPAGVRLWEMAGHREIGRLEPLTEDGKPEPVEAVAFHPDGAQLATVGGRSLRIWQVATGEQVGVLPVAAWPMVVSFSPTGETLATCGFGEPVRLWEVAGQRELATVPAKGCSSLAFAPTGATLAYVDGRDVVVIDPTDQQELDRLSGHIETTGAVSFDAAGDHLIIGTGDEVLRWEPAAQDVPQIIIEATDEVRRVAVTAKGHMIATAGSGHLVRLWGWPDGDRLVTFRRHTDQVRAITFDPGGELLATGSVDGTVRLWRVPGR